MQKKKSPLRERGNSKKEKKKRVRLLPHPRPGKWTECQKGRRVAEKGGGGNGTPRERGKRLFLKEGELPLWEKRRKRPSDGGQEKKSRPAAKKKTSPRVHEGKKSRPTAGKGISCGSPGKKKTSPTSSRRGGKKKKKEEYDRTAGGTPPPGGEKRAST